MVHPASIGSTAPVISLPASLQRNEANAPTFSIATKRPVGCRVEMYSRCASVTEIPLLAAIPSIFAKIGGVGNVPGHNALQVMPALAASIAIARVKPIRAVLVVI